MKRSRKSKVSWASNSNLCQVKLFLVDDCPCKVSSELHSHNQGKSSSLTSSTRRQSADVPPGFEGNHYTTSWNLSAVSRIKWKCPPKLSISSNWLVAAGEESNEKQIQKLSETIVFEAIYPHRSSVPPCPAVSSDVDAEQYDDSQTPVVRLTPIEEDEELAVASSHMAPQTIVPVTQQTQPLPQGQSASKPLSILLSNTPSSGKPAPAMVPDLGADLVAATSAVLATLMKSKEQGSMIDTDLLVKILGDPKMVENLIKDQNHKPPDKEVSRVDLKTTSMFLSQTRSALVPHPNPTTSAMTLSQPVVNSSAPVSHSNPNTAMISVAVDKSSHPLPNGIPVSPGFTTPQRLTYPVFESKRVEPSVPKGSSEPAKVSSPGFGNGNPHAVAMSIQPGSGLMLSQLKPVQMAQLVFSTLPMNVNPLPVSAGPKAEPTSSTMPMSLNPFQVSAGLMPEQMAQPAFLISAGPKPVGMFQANQSAVPMNVNQVKLSAGVKPNPSVKELDYVKNLIREHGIVKAPDIHNNQFPQTGQCHGFAQNLNAVQNIKLVEARPKIQKPCMYFTSSRGCRLGAKCAYLHDPSSEWWTGSLMEAPGSKRMKFGGEITGA